MDIPSRLLNVLIFWAAFGAIISKSKAERLKRSLWNFNGVVRCATGRYGFDFLGYGCWCGRGGSGVPVDLIDR